MAAPDPIVVSILPADAVQARQELDALSPDFGPVELRADHLSATDVAGFVASTPRDVIVTVRRVGDGGGYTGDERARRGMIEAALEAGARWVDVEGDSDLADLAEGPHAGRVILSDHGLPCDRETLRRRIARRVVSRAARLKVVATAERPSQIVAIREVLLEHGDGRLCAFARGPAGALSRILAPAWGSWGTYAAARQDAATAEGQFTAAHLRRVFDVASIGESTRLVALAGNDVVPRSPSPAMHNAGYRALRMDRVYVPLEADDWGEIVRLNEALGFAGLAVTMPFKSAAAAEVDQADDVARAARAVNTIVFENGVGIGANTDGPAAVACLRERGLARGDSIDVLGAGGTGRAIAAALGAAGYRATVWSRRAPRDGAGPAGWRALEQRGEREVDWLVNATPVRDASLLREGPPARRGVLDAVYGTPPTELVRRAREEGLRVVEGLDLLVAQAELQFDLHTGRTPPAGLFAEVGQRYLADLG